MGLRRRSRVTPAERARARGPLAAVLAARRQELDLTQSELADLAGVVRGPIVALEAGRTVSLDVLLSVLEVLGLHLELVRGTASPAVSVSADLAQQYDLAAADDTVRPAEEAATDD